MPEMKAVQAILVLCVLMLSSGGGVAADETYEAVVTTGGTTVVFGPTNTYTIWALDIGIGYLFRFYFGLGYSGDTVRTDTAVTMGAWGDATQIYACQGGKLQLVAVNSSGTPQESIIRVRYNSTDNAYRLQITEASPAVYVQFVYLSQGGLLCTSGVAGSPIRFEDSSSSSSNEPTIATTREYGAAGRRHDQLLVRQVVDSE